MRLIVHELITELSQSITVKDEDVKLHAIRPHLYRHNFPSGSLYLEIWNEQNELIATSEHIVIDTISNALYFHGLVRFFIAADLKANSLYTITLKATGYTFSEQAYVGWVNDHDLRVLEAGYEVKTATQAPLLLEPWVLRDQIRRGL